MQEDKIRQEEQERLFAAILSLESAEECRCFFEDLCTIKELNAMAQRLEVAVLLKQGETFNNIVEKRALPPQPFPASTDASDTERADTAACCQNKIVRKCGIWYDKGRAKTYYARWIRHGFSQKGREIQWIM